MAVLLLPLLARRRFPFAAPAAYWLLAAAISFGDGLLLAFIGSLGVVGLASAFLLGNLRNPLKAGAGLIIVLVGIVIVVYNIPGPQTVGDFVFIPPLRSRLGRGLRAAERAEQAEAAEERATHAGDAASQPHASRWRRSVCESPARLDVVAHAVSVMVSRSAPSNNLTAASEDHDLLRGVERAGRTALAEMRRLLAAMRREGTKLNSRPSLARRPRFVARRSQPRWSAGRVTCRRDAASPEGDRPLCLPHRSRRPDECSQARACQRRRRDCPLSARRARDRGT